MRITIVGKYPPIQGGVSRMVYAALNDLTDAGHEVELVTNSLEVEPNFRQLLFDDDLVKLGTSQQGRSLRVRYTTPDEADGKTQYIPHAKPYLSKLFPLALDSIRDNNSELIIGWYFEPYAVAAMMASQFTGVPLAVVHAGSDVGALSHHPDLRRTYECLIRSANHVITSVSGGVRREILDSLGLTEAVARYPGTASVESHFLDHSTPLNVDEVTKLATDFIAALSLPEAVRTAVLDMNEKEFDPSIPTVGIFGKVGRTKGSFTLLRALSCLADEGIDFNFLTMSSGWPYLLEPYLGAIAERPQLCSRTWYIPPLAPWRVSSFILACNALFFLEHDFPIPFHNPRVPREVLSQGRCLVLSQQQIETLGFGDSLVHRKNFVRVADPTSATALADQLRWVLSHPLDVRSIGLHGKVLSRHLEGQMPNRSPILNFVEELTGSSSDPRTERPDAIGSIA